MERTLRSLTAASLVTWSFYLLYIVVVMATLSEWMSTSEVVPTILVPVAMMVVSLWIGFWSQPKLPERAALVGQFLVLAVGCLFVVSAFTARAG